jgi:hypothetical protein
MLRAVLLAGLLILSACGGNGGGLFGNTLPDCRTAAAKITDPDDPYRTFDGRVRVCRTESSRGWYVSPRFQ